MTALPKLVALQKLAPPNSSNYSVLVVQRKMASEKKKHRSDKREKRDKWRVFGGEEEAKKMITVVLFCFVLFLFLYNGLFTASTTTKHRFLFIFLAVLHTVPQLTVLATRRVPVLLSN